MKRFISFMMVVVLIMSLGGCEKGNVQEVFTPEDYDWATSQAETLTKHVISSMGLVPYGTAAEVEKLGVNTFVIMTPRSIGIDGYLYEDFSRGEELVFPPKDELGEFEFKHFYRYFFPADKVTQMVHEVFGIEDWILDAGDMYLNPSSNEYESGLEFGFGIMTETKDFSVQIDQESNIVEVRFLKSYYGIEGPDGDPAWSEFAEMTVRFQMMKEDGRIFLRLLEYSTTGDEL